MTKAELLTTPIEHFDMTAHNVVPLVDAMRHMAFSARDLARAADITARMVRDPECGVILCLAGSLVSAGLKKVFADAIRCNMVDAVVSTGANVVDQDFFEALGFRHHVGEERLRSGMHDADLRDLRIDRIYDTLIDEDELRECDDVTRRNADALDPRPYSSREFVVAMGAYLDRHGCKTPDSIVYEAYKADVPVFCPAFSDCSAGFGLVAHHIRGDGPKVSIDSARTSTN
ncbi:MAG: deoxyhypusine synthase family protein [Gemmataceae bacterium]